MDALDMLANNVANATTAGFKADREFNSVWEFDLPYIEKNWIDFSQGTLVETNNPLNLALSGKGFFALNTPGGTVFTRNGDFRISKKNEIETADGFTLRNALDQGRPIKVDPAVPIQIGKNGIVTQSGQEIGKLEIVDLEKTSITKRGSLYFQLNDLARPGAKASEVEVKQGYLESSNVPVGEATVRLVSVMRQFEMLQRAMALGAEMNKRAVEEVARVNP
jgi:flagellar basal body rod protein FlgG